MKKQIIFDMDGVLFDTEQLVLGYWRYLAEKYNISKIEETFQKVIGINREETKQILFDTYGEEFPYDKFFREVHLLFHKRIQTAGMPVKKGVRELLGFLKINGYRIGLASSTRYQTVTDELTQAGLLDFFEVIVGGDMVKKSKPEPDIYLRACEEMRVLPSETFAVEDSWNGVRSAAAAGLRVIHVPDMQEPNEEMEQLAFQIFDDLIDVRNYLARNSII